MARAVEGLGVWRRWEEGEEGFRKIDLLIKREVEEEKLGFKKRREEEEVAVAMEMEREWKKEKEKEKRNVSFF